MKTNILCAACRQSFAAERRALPSFDGEPAGLIPILNNGGSGNSPIIRCTTSRGGGMTKPPRNPSVQHAARLLEILRSNLERTAEPALRERLLQAIETLERRAA